MRILLLNQCFYPDVVSTAQHLSDLAVELAAKGHKVTVIASDRGYDDPARRFSRREIWKTINIVRIPVLNLGKHARWRRALSFASFLSICALRLLRSERFDLVVALTSPPLIALLASWFCKLKGGRFLFWVMDLNPDEAIVAGWLKKRSITARILTQGLKYSLHHATRVIVLDRFMKERLLEKGVAAQKIVVLPPWSHDDRVHYDFQAREQFRAKYDLTDKFVVMYSGNHSPCHPLDTLREAARCLTHLNDLAFCFVGGGSEQARVRDFSEQHSLTNVKCLPYQPLNTLSGSLSAADLHVVVMGNEFRGIVHPCKVYNVLLTGKPVIYIGPEPSHITEIAVENHGAPITRVAHGDVDAVVRTILNCREQQIAVRPSPEIVNKFSKTTVLPQMLRTIEATIEEPAEALDMAEIPLIAP